MVKRIVYGAGLIAILLLVVWLEHVVSRFTDDSSWNDPKILLTGLPTRVVVCILVVVGFMELDRLARAAGTRLLYPAGVIGIVCFMLLPNLYKLGAILGNAYPVVTESYGAVFTFLKNPITMISLIVLLVFFNQMCTRRVEGALLRIASTLLAVFYLGFLGMMVFTVRLAYGLGMLLVFLAAVKLTDVGAYFTGSLCGKHKLIPWLSPGKSWEGLIGGLFLAAIVGLVAYGIARAAPPDWKFYYSLSLPQSVLFCLVLGLAGQFGDLCESLLKRSAGVKDAGNLVPQFGGVLDIIDSPLIAAPFAHLFLSCCKA